LVVSNRISDFSAGGFKNDSNSVVAVKEISFIEVFIFYWAKFYMPFYTLVVKKGLGNKKFIIII
jgi:hypothetical protein